MTTRNIPFFNYPHVFKSHEEAFMDIFRDVGQRGAFIMQQDLYNFEQNLAKFTGAEYVLGVGNATDGLHLSLRAAGIGSGDEVIFSSHTMVATASSIYFAGATPVPVDCRGDHLIDPDAVRAAITSHTKAIVPTQLNGRMCDMDALQTLADEYGLIIIEDAAQALGARYKNKCAGTFGLAGAISFYPAKTLGCLGDGGVVLTDDAEMHEKLSLIRDHGRNESGEVVLWGLTSRLDNLQAAILNYKLSFYNRDIDRRREIASLYQQLLGDIEELVLPPAPDSDAHYFDIFQNYEIEATRRDELKDHLKAQGIGTLIQWGGKAVHQFGGLGFQVELPFTEQMFTRCIMLPMNCSLSNEDVAYVAENIRQFYGYK